MIEHQFRCIVCRQHDCTDPNHMASHAQAIMLTDAMSIAAVLKRREPTELTIGDVKIRVVIDPTMPPGEARLIAGPRPEHQVRAVGLTE
jgi:hypothetical protein